MKSKRSGSPTAQNLRKKAYREQSGAVSNPDQRSGTNRAARRAAKGVYGVDFARFGNDRSVTLGALSRESTPHTPESV